MIEIHHGNLRSVLVQLVMLLLAVASLVSWTMIFRKRTVLRQARRAANDFEERFWSGKDLVSMYNRITSRKYAPTGMERIFETGFKEFARLRKQSGIEPQSVLDGTHRAMRVSLAREMDELELHLAFLATVGSTSPYVGLFGTVWGIMNSFRALGNVNQFQQLVFEILILIAQNLNLLLDQRNGFSRRMWEAEFCQQPGMVIKEVRMAA